MRIAEAVGSAALCARRACTTARLLPLPALRTRFLGRVAELVADWLERARRVASGRLDEAEAALAMWADPRQVARSWRREAQADALQAWGTEAAAGAIVRDADGVRDTVPRMSDGTWLAPGAGSVVPRPVLSALGVATACRAAARELQAPVDGVDPAAVARSGRAMLRAADALEVECGRVSGEVSGVALAATVQRIGRASPPAKARPATTSALTPSAAAALATGPEQGAVTATGGSQACLTATELRSAFDTTASLRPLAARELLAGAQPLAALAGLSESRGASVVGGAAVRALRHAALISASLLVNAALTGPRAALQAAHHALAVVIATTHAHGIGGSTTDLRLAGCFRLTGRARSDAQSIVASLRAAAPELDGVVRDSTPAQWQDRAAESGAHAARQQRESWARLMVGASLEGEERLASALWGSVRGREALLVREMLAAKGLAGCSTFEVLCVGAKTVQTT